MQTIATAGHFGRDIVATDLDLDGDLDVLTAESHPQITPLNLLAWYANQVDGLLTSYCSGTGCPCGNDGSAESGCSNSSGAGAVLDGAGSNSVQLDDLLFTASGLLPGQPALLFSGHSQVRGGAGVTFGDGLRCAGGQVSRLAVRVPDVTGTAAWGPGYAAAEGWQSGDSRTFQVWYRDPLGSPCGGQFNLSNGLSVTLTP